MGSLTPEMYGSATVDTPTKTYTAQYQGKILKEEFGIPVTDKCQTLFRFRLP